MDEKKSWLVDDAFDYKGNPANSAKTGGWVPAVLILGIEMCERLSTMAIAVNLVTYLIGTMHLPSSSSANIVTNFMGISFLLCLFGGFLADSFLGRFKTVAIFSVVQALGTAMLSFSTKVPKFRPPPCDEHGPCQRATGFQMGILYLSLCLIAMGTGGLKSSVSGFGSDQFDEKDEKEKAQMTAFFSRFFFFISLGTLIAVTVLVWLQDEVGRSWGYGICCISMVIAIVIFLSGVKKYRYKKSKGSPLVHILQVISAAVKKNKMQLSHDLNLFEDTPEGKRVPHTQQFKFLDKAAIVAEGDFENIPDASSPKPNPWKLCSVTKVEEVKMMVRLLPVWATTIIFWTTYAQLITFSVEQASTMDRSIGSFQIPAGSLTVFFVSAILFTLAIYDQIIVPIWKKWKGKPGFSSLQRIAIGLVLATLGMIAAAMAEKKRLSAAKAVGRDTQTLPISVYYLIPQFFLVGSGEAFIYIGQLDFFITQSPKSMKTISTGIFLTTLSLGFFVSSFLVSVIKSTTGTRDSPGWLADNINYGRLDKFYWLLTTLSAINFVLFMMCAIWFKPPKKNNSSSRVSNASDGSFGEADEKC